MLHISVIVPNATVVVHGISFGGMHPGRRVVYDMAGIHDIFYL